MAETRITPTFPVGRYGKRRGRRTRRWVAPVLAVIVIAAGLVVSIRMYAIYGQPEYRVSVLYAKTTETQVTVRFEVYKKAGRPAVCTVRARAYNGEEVGKAKVDVPAGESGRDSVVVEHTLPTAKPPYVGEVPGCGPKR